MFCTNLKPFDVRCMNMNVSLFACLLLSIILCLLLKHKNELFLDDFQTLICAVKNSSALLLQAAVIIPIKLKTDLNIRNIDSVSYARVIIDEATI